MKIVISSRGSRGDVYPIIEIAGEFCRTGTDVSLCVPVMFKQYAASRCGSVYCYSEDMNMAMKEMGSGLKALKPTLQWFSRSLEEQMNFMLGQGAGAGAMVCSVNEIAAPTVAEYFNIPLFRIAYTPVLPGYHPPPLIPWQNFPPMVNRCMWHGVNGMTGLFIKNMLNEKRGALGMKPISSINEYFTGSSHTLMTINRVLAPPCPSWAKKYQYHYTGYCYSNSVEEIDQGLADFIGAGPRPVYIGFGSVSVKDPEGFTYMILDAVSRAGCRAVLGSGWTGLGGTDLPKHVYQVKETDHAALFPFCAAAAHHGGSGTTHTAARAGIPQFIMPQIADQFYWGHRIHRLGLGPAPVRPEKLTVKKLTAIFRDLNHNDVYSGNARDLGGSMRAENGIPGVVEIVRSTTGLERKKSGCAIGA